MGVNMRHEMARRNFCDFCADYLSKKNGGASSISLKEAYIDSYPNRVNRLARSTVGLSIWLRSDVKRRFTYHDKLWYFKGDSYELEDHK